MEYLSQVEKLVEVLAFFVTKLPLDLVNKDVFEEYMAAVNEIVYACQNTGIKDILVKEDLNYTEEEDSFMKEDLKDITVNDHIDESSIDEKDHLNVPSPSPIQIKFKTKNEVETDYANNTSLNSRNPKKLHFGHLSQVDDGVILMYNCIFCEQILETASLYEKHDQENHIRDNEYFCPETGCTFQDESKMKVMHHFTKEHLNVTLKVCSLCKEGYLTTVL